MPDRAPLKDSDRAVRPVMIMSAPNGARRRATDHPALPLTPEDLAQCATDLLAEGVSVLHLHVRDDQGGHSLDPERYRAEPDAARFYAWLQRERIWPQHILYSIADIERFELLRRRGLLAQSEPSCLLVLGRYSRSLEGHPGELGERLARLDTEAVSWAVCSFGQHENAVALAATEKGGHVRLGFENNLLLCDGTPARDNAELIAQFCQSMAHLKRRPATADEIRARWLN